MCGDHPNGRSTYGHSLVIDPWGKVIAELEDRPGVLVAEIDTDACARVRSMLPSLQHDREFSVQRCE
jgi:predicted amidohydrolase